jgi:predicted Zn-dependent protease
MPRPLAAMALLVAALVPAGCESAPYTGRSQFLLISEAQENALGVQAFQETLAASKLSTNAAWTARLERVGRRIAAVAERPAFEWEFRLIAEPTVNAFCLPGGKVAFYEGIMPICGDDTGVAVVMGHEVAHALARHGGERVSRGIVSDLGTDVLASVLGGQDKENQARVAQALGAGAQVGLLLPWGREQESEADRIGLILMAKAGYDPREAPRFWERMEAATGSGGRPPEFLSTHPSPGTRMRQLEAWMPEALAHYAGR